MSYGVSMTSGFGIVVFKGDNSEDLEEFWDLPIIPLAIKEYEDLYGDFTSEEEMYEVFGLEEVEAFVHKHYPLIILETGGFDGFLADTVAFVRRTRRHVSSYSGEFVLNNDQTDTDVSLAEQLQLQEIATLFNVPYDPHVYTVSYYG